MRRKAHSAALDQLGHEIERGKTPGALMYRSKQEAPLHGIACGKVGHAGDVVASSAPVSVTNGGRRTGISSSRRMERVDRSLDAKSRRN
jgi:hypothetical protein